MKSQKIPYFLEELMLKKRNKPCGSVGDVRMCCRIIQAMMIEQLLCARLCHRPGGYRSEQKTPAFVELTFWCWDQVGDRKQTNMTGNEMCYGENNLVVDAYGRGCYSRRRIRKFPSDKTFEQRPKRSGPHDFSGQSFLSISNVECKGLGWDLRRE